VGTANYFLISDEQELNKGVKLEDIIRRYGKPDKLSDDPNGGKRCLYFNKVQFVSDKTGIVTFVFIKLV